MWYLVVPPIVVVSSLFFLLWYLLRKGSDPAITQKILENDKEQKPLFPGIKGFFLKRIEKFAQRFKVGLLRAHNKLNEFTQSVKKMRTKAELAARSDEKPDVPDSFQEDPASELSAENRPYLYDAPLIPLANKEHGGDIKKETVEIQEKKVLIPRPTVSATVARPEVVKSASRRGGFQEENLIARIARDPKDFTAYEELGDYYLEMGSIKDAKECYRQVLKLSPVHRLVKIKIRRLEKLLTRGGE